MFGYITPSLGNLSEQDKERYMALYCGLCRALGKQTGELSRLTLSFDMLLLALAQGSLYEPVETVYTKGCLAHPLEPRTYSVSSALDYAADMTVLLAYYKCKDDWFDDRNLTARLFQSALKAPFAKVQQRWPRQCSATALHMNELVNAEARSDSLDKAANLFGMVMGELFVWREDFWADAMYTFGARLGKFIYVMDAVCDLEADVRSGSYNPFSFVDFDQKVMLQYLQMLAGQVVCSFEKIPFDQDIEIMRNILYSGIWQRYRKKMQLQTTDTSTLHKA